jgi:hypothetical protein
MYADGIMTASAEGLFVQPKGGMHSIDTQTSTESQ